MKKILLTPIIFLAAANLFAALTETLNENFKDVTGKTVVPGYDIVGTGSVNELSSSTYNWIRLSGTLNFDSDKSITLTASNTLLGTSGYYSFMALNASGATLNFTGAGTLTTPNANNAGLNSYKGPLTINVAKGAGGIITPKVCGQTQTLTLNLNQENAIRRADGAGFNLCLVIDSNLSMSANQHIGIDFRSNTNLNLNITNGSYLFIDRVDAIITDGITSKIKVADNKLEDGAILFSKDVIKTGYDSETGKLVVFSGSKTQNIEIKTSNNTALTGLNWDEVSIDGKDYYMLTGMPVPEPAEWAALFGAAALALAVYRRRK